MPNLLLALVLTLAPLFARSESHAQEKAVAPVVLQAPSVNVQQTFAYGALNRYQIEQGLMKRQIDISSLFVPGTI